MSHAIVLREAGGPDKLRYESVEVADPGPGELLIRHTVIGVNFHDCYVRSGLYRTLKLPGIPGLEGAAVVEKVGPGVTGWASGDRIAYIDTAYGAYSQRRLLPAVLALRLPNTVSDEAAASLTIKGFTACMLLRKVHAVRRGETLLIHAAAGGVGQPLVRWAKHLGATVIATVGSEEKAAIARDCGADHVILYRQENFVERVAQITSGRGVDVAYDSVVTGDI
jgi:NADPH2:quinone reductase